MDLYLIHIILVRIKLHDLNYYHTHTNRFIHFRFLKWNIYILYMYCNNYQHHIHLIMDQILMSYINQPMYNLLITIN